MINKNKIMLLGGVDIKIHLAVDANRNPVEFILGNCTTHDIKVASDLIDCLDFKETEILCADKGDDSSSLREKINNTQTKANILKKSNSKSSNENMDLYLYKIKHLVKNTFARFKQFRGIATRYDKLTRNYENSVALACIFIWLPL